MINISIVTFNTPVEELNSIINSIYKNISLINSIYIIDNSSSDSLGKFNFGPKVIYFHDGINRGYGSGHNIGIRESIKCGIPYHLIVNADVFFEQGVLERLYHKIKNDNSISMLTPKILYPDNKTQFLCKLLPNPFDLFLRRFLPFDKIQYKHQYRYELRFLDYDREMEVPNLSGCFMFCRTSCLEKIGGFDERFFLYLEDVDLTRRMSLYGRTLYYPSVNVFHNYGKQSYKSFRLLKMHMISAVKYFNKWGWFNDDYRKIKNMNMLYYKQPDITVAEHVHNF